MIDNSVVGLFVFSLASLIIASGLFGTQGTAILTSPFFTNVLLASITGALVMVPINAAVLSWTGATLGKWFLGLRVLTPEGQPLSFGTALSRELNVFVVGLGLSIPLISLITMITAYQRLNRDGVSSWDAPDRSVVRYQSHTALTRLRVALGLALLMVALITMQALGSAA